MMNNDNVMSYVSEDEPPNEFQCSLTKKTGKTIINFRNFKINKINNKIISDEVLFDDTEEVGAVVGGAAATNEVRAEVDVEAVNIEVVEDTKGVEEKAVVEGDTRAVEEDMRAEDSEAREGTMEMVKNSLLFNIQGNL